MFRGATQRPSERGCSRWLAGSNSYLTAAGMHMTIQYEVEEELESGLKYTEDTSRIEQSRLVRDCCLWQAGVAEPISGLNVLSFRQRFGAVAVPAEGIGGVETVPAFRRQGHIRTLLTKVVAGMAKRVPVAFVSDGIEGLY